MNVHEGKPGQHRYIHQARQGEGFGDLLGCFGMHRAAALAVLPGLLLSEAAGIDPRDQRCNFVEIKAADETIHQIGGDDDALRAQSGTSFSRP